MKRFTSLVLSAVMFICATLGTFLSAYAGDPVFGIDVSEHNGVVDFVDVKDDNKEFVMIRLGYYDTIDKYFWSNVKKAHNAKMDFGVYLYSYAYSVSEARIEANFVIDTLEELEERGYGRYFTLPVAYDLEEPKMAQYGKTQITKQMTTFCDMIKNAGYVPMVYANLNWFTNYINLNTAVSKGYKLWYAYWVNGSPSFSSEREIGNTGVKADMWQYINGEVQSDGFDKNVIYNTDELIKCRHNYGAQKIQQATKDSDGYMQSTCSWCGNVSKTTIPRISSAALSKTSYTYDGNQKNPTVTVKDRTGKTLKNGTDYTVSYASGRTDVGTYNVTVTYKGNYSGTDTLSFKVIQQIPERCTPVLSKTSYTYDGNEKNPTVKITDVVGNVLKKDVDYTLTYDEGRTDVGTYNVNIAYKGNYSGTDTVSFKVIHQIPERCTPKLSETTYVYDGTQKTPTVSITDVVDNVLKEGTDYTLTYDVGRTEPGTYNVNITYKGNYSGTDTLRFRIIDPSTEKLTASLSKTSYTYDGNEKNPTVTIKDAQGNVLTKDVDYTLSYDAGRTDVGTYNVEITYKGYYTGSETLNFVIKPQIPERCTPKLSKTSYTYDGNEKNPTVTIKDVVNNVLVEGRDYTLAYDSGRTNAGTYNVKITYKGNYSGTDTVSFKVIQQIPSRCTATLSTTATYYNGSVKTPGVTVKDVVNNTLKNGRDYTVTMDAGRKNVGRYAVKITYKGNYSGSQTLYFNIIPRGITNIKSVSARSKGFTVQWPTQTTQTTGYQIQYSTSSSFSNAKTITMPKSTYYAKKVTGLTANKRYYVRIRTYKTTKFNGKNYNVYSFWCATKSVVTGK